MLKQLSILALAVLFAFSAETAAAQEEGTIAGTVVDSTSSESLPGVNVVIEELGVGAATDAEGQFEITEVPAGSYTLTASFVGYATTSTSVDVQPNEITRVEIQLPPAAVELEDVVVTALGIERAERSLGYAVQEVEGAELAEAPETNFLSTLTGRVSGAQVTNSSQMGGSTRIVLRGPSSVAGNNEPLIVVDGIPLDNSNFTTDAQATGSGGYDYGNAASMINPNDIESVSVLKGASAAALYGSRAANGVIQITTKSGAREQGIGITVRTGVTTSNVYNLPNYQDLYGGGAWAPFSMNDEGQLVADFATDQSWGPRLDGREVRQWYSYDDVNGLAGQATPWVAHPDNVENYFEQGLVFNTNVAFAQGGEDFNYRLSLNNMEQEGVFPNSNMGRTAIGFHGSLTMVERLTTRVTANYIDENAQARPGTGYTNAISPWLQFNQFGQRQIDLGPDSYMRDYERPDGTQRSWNWVDPVAGDIIYANNPYWISYENYNNDDTERLYGSVALAYEFTEALTLEGAARTDFYTSRRQERVAVGSVEQPEYVENLYEVQETNGSVELSYDGQISETISLQALGGTSYRYRTVSQNLGETQGGLSSPDLYTLENSISRPNIDDYDEESAIFGLYTDVTVGYQDLVYLEGTLRNDWSSTLPDDNNAYLYPSINASFVFSGLPAFEEQTLISYGKVRVGWSEVGRDTDPYRLNFTYPLNTPYGATAIQTLPRILNNPELKPERTSGWEVGGQVEFFNNRIGLDLTYYSQATRDQILAVGVSRSSGFESTVINAGTLENEGVELALSTTPVLTEQFQWNVNLNWARNVNEVTDLPEGIESIGIGVDNTPPFGPFIVAREGEPYGAFFGTGFIYDQNGNRVVGANGLFQTSGERVLGSYLPDWTAGLSTTLSYGGFSVGALIDGQMGGKMWSLSNLFGLYSGIFEETAENNIREVGMVPEAVWFPQNHDDNPDNDVNPEEAVGEEWTGRVDPNLFFTSLFGNHEAHLYDATFVKLREVTVGYTVPVSWFGTWPVERLHLGLVGRNLTTLYKETPNFDPSTALSAANQQGIEAGQMPPVRSYGFNVQVTF